MSKAFDCIDRKKLLEYLSKCLEPDEIHVFKILLVSTEMPVRVDNLTGKPFNTNISTPQGDVASAQLFALYLACRLQNLNVPTDGILYQHEKQFADDIGWVSISIQYLNQIKVEVIEILKAGNLVINE